MAMILEEAESPAGDRISTIETKRGEEYVVNLDEAVCALLDLFSDLDTELREGWTLSASWYWDALQHLRKQAIVTEI